VSIVVVKIAVIDCINVNMIALHQKTLTIGPHRPTSG